MRRRGRGAAGSGVRVFSFDEGDDVGEAGARQHPSTPGASTGAEGPDGAASARGPVADPAADGSGTSDTSGADGSDPADLVVRRRPGSRRSRLAVGAGVCVAALVVGGLVVGEAVDARRTDRVVAAGGLRPLGADAEVVWRIEPPEVSGDPSLTRWNQPIDVGGTLVRGGASVTGFDPATGEALWQVTEAFESAGPGQRVTFCEEAAQGSDLQGLMVCTTMAFVRGTEVGALTYRERFSGLQVVDPATGAVVASHAFEEDTRGAVVFEDGVATVRWGADGQAVVTLEDLDTAAVVWTRQVDLAAAEGVPPDDEQLGLWREGDKLGVLGGSATVTLDAAGEVGAQAVDSFVVPLREGRSVVQGTDGSAASVLDREGNEVLRVEGQVQEFGVTDGSPTSALLVTEGGGVLDASGSITRPVTTAHDPVSGRTLWTEERQVDVAVAQVGDLGVLSGVGRLWAVDLASGEQVWEASGIRFYSMAYTDGTDLYLVGAGTSGGTRITAISMDSGQELWVRDLADSFDVSISAGGNLVGWSDDGRIFGVG